MLGELLTHIDYCCCYNKLCKRYTTAEDTNKGNYRETISTSRCLTAQIQSRRSGGLSSCHASHGQLNVPGGCPRCHQGERRGPNPPPGRRRRAVKPQPALLASGRLSWLRDSASEQRYATYGLQGRKTTLCERSSIKPNVSNNGPWQQAARN